MKKMRIFAVLCAIVLVAASLAGCIVNTNPAVRVNGTDLTKDEFGYYLYAQAGMAVQEAGVNTSDPEAVKAYLDGETDGKKNMDTIREKAIEEAAKILVQCNKAAELGIELSEEDKTQVETDIANIKQQIGGESAFVEQLRMCSTTPEAFEALYTKEALVNKLMTKLKEDGTITITDEESEKYIRDEYIKAAHILFMTVDAQTGQPYDEETISQKKAQAEETLGKINAGEDFMKLMNELSEDTGLATAPDGYEFPRGQMVPEFEDAAFALAENQVSDIVETSYGFHIIKRLPFEVTAEVVDKYREDAKMAMETDKYNALVEEWKNASDVESFKSVTKSVELVAFQ